MDRRYFTIMQKVKKRLAKITLFKILVLEHYKLNNLEGKMNRFFIFILILLSVSLLFSSGGERLVILGIGHLDRDSRTITGMLTADRRGDLVNILGAGGYYDVIIGREVTNAFRAENIEPNMSTLTSHEAGIIGERLDAEIVLWGTVVGLTGNMFRLSGSMRNQRTGNTANFSLQVSRDRAQRENALRSELLTRLQEFSRTEATRMFDQALQLFHNDLFDSAEDAFRRIVRIDRYNMEAWYYYGFIQFVQNRFPMAVEVFLQGLEIDPNNETLLLNLAESYRRQGMFDLSIQTLERVAETRSDKGIYYNIAMMQRDRGNVEDALNALDRAIGIDDDFEPIRRLYAEITYDNNMFDRAIEHLLFVTNVNPDDEESARRLAISFQRTGRLDEAIRQYQAIIAGDNNNLRAFLNLASAYRAIALENVSEANRFNRLALEAFMNARRIDPDNARVEISIADVHLALNDFANAERFANSAKQKQPNLFEASLIIGSIAQRRGIDRYNTFVELQTLTEGGTLFGSELDETIRRRDTTRREAHNLFNQAHAQFREALGLVETDRLRNEINQRIQGNQQYITLTVPDFFD